MHVCMPSTTLGPIRSTVGTDLETFWNGFKDIFLMISMSYSGQVQGPSSPRRPRPGSHFFLHFPPVPLITASFPEECMGGPTLGVFWHMSIGVLRLRRPQGHPGAPETPGAPFMKTYQKPCVF